MKIVSFNINGIKSFVEYIKQKYAKDLNSYLTDILEADIACFQEVKTTARHMHSYSTMKDYMTFANLNKEKNGIYGVATFVRKSLYCRKHNINVPFTEEGRTILTDHGTFKVLNIYFPFYDENGNKERDKVINFYDTIKNFINKFDNLIICGDFNAVYSPFDHFIYLKEYFKTSEALKECELKECISTKSFFDDEYIDRALNLMNCNIRHTEHASKEKILQNIKNKTDNYKVQSNNELMFYHSAFMNIYIEGKSRYYDYIYDSIKDAEFPCDIPEDEHFSRFREGLIEKRYCSKIEQPYLLHTKQQVLGLMFSTYQRLWLLKLILEMRYIDIFRLYSSEYHRYTCWNTILNLRPTNQGTRIDYILVSSKLLESVAGGGILSEIQGSDHCPVFAMLKIRAEGKDTNILNCKNNLLAFFKPVSE